MNKLVKSIQCLSFEYKDEELWLIRVKRSMVTVSIHQPNYLPYLGFFDKMRKSDIFVIYDDSQFNSRDFHHRNKIRTSEGWKWLTIPVVEEKTCVRNIKIKQINNWENKHFTAIRANYLKSKYFSEYSEAFEKIYSGKYEYLIDFNVRLIQFIKECFGIKTEIAYSSEFLLNSKSTEKLIDIVKACGGDTYLSGSGGHNYIDESLFEQADIKLEFQEFEHPVYNQRYPGFVPNLSAIDFLFNEGVHNLN